MPTFAKNTIVPTDRSRLEIEHILLRYGATKFAYGLVDDFAVIQFELENLRMRFMLPMPNKDDEEISKTPRGRWRRKAAIPVVYEQAKRQRWRALALSIKAKLESVESKIETTEEAFLAQIVLPNGRTVSEATLPGIREAYQSGDMPRFPLLERPRNE